MRVEATILRNLIQREEFTKRVLPFLKPEYFNRNEDKLLFNEINAFILKYGVLPTYDSLKIEANNIYGYNDDTIKEIINVINEFEKDTNQTNLDWLVENTEKFCQERALFNAITQSVEIMGGKSQLQKGAIPELLSDALAISFDSNIGHSFFEQAEDRYEYYHRKEEKIPFDIDIFNKATKDGVTKKTLNMIMAGVHVGKTLVLCHLASSYLVMGKDVLYITLEISEEEITKRIDANVLNVSFDDLMALPKDLYLKKVKNLRNKTQGELIVKEYPGTSANVLHFKALLNELKLKKNFIPDVIMIDYLNICSSSRIKASGAQDLYSWVKSIAEEVRGLAQQTGIPIWSATQLNRTGFKSSDPDMADTAESFGLPATIDLQWVLIVNDQLKQLNQIMIKQLKNRYDNLDNMKRFVVGVDRSKMKLYDVEETAQDLVDTDNEILNIAPMPTFKKKYSGLKT
jgi:replicative DNA helicase